MTRRAPACRIDDVPGCDTGPGGRLAFVLREARAAWRRRRDPLASSPAPPADRTDPFQGGTR